LKDFFREKLLGIAVFGSFARGAAEFPGSDIDILIVIEDVEKLSFGERLKLTMKVEKKLSKTEEYAKFKDAFGWSPSIQEVILTPEELKAHPPILLDLTTDAVILYDKGILREELEKLREKLKQFTTLAEIPPVPWGYSYMVALTHDVDITSVSKGEMLVF
jgi:predicted nucleotidyltransferase